MLLSIYFMASFELLLAAQQHLEAAASTAAELKAGQPFQIFVECVQCDGEDADDEDVDSESLLDALVDAIHDAGGGKIDVLRWG